MFFLILDKKVWHYVALCGAMKNSCFFAVFAKMCFFLILEKKMWRYVALCGAMKNSCFLLFLQKCVFFDFGEKSVALCGAMWRYEK